MLGEDIFLEKINISYASLCEYIGSENIKNIIFFPPLFHKNIPDGVNIILIMIEAHSNADIILRLGERKKAILLNYTGYCTNPYINTSIKNYFFPHCVIHNVEFNKNPKNKILVCGRGIKNNNVYPMRVKMYQLSKIDNRIEHLPVNHPYFVNDLKRLQNFTCGQNFINVLNSYHICFTDDSTINTPFIVCKFFEILSSGALLLASNKNTKKYFEHLGFIDGEHYISLTDENMLEKIDFVMDKKKCDLIEKIRYNGYVKCNQYHNCYYRAEQLDKIINGTDEAVYYNDGIDGTQYFIAK